MGKEACAADLHNLRDKTKLKTIGWLKSPGKLRIDTCSNCTVPEKNPYPPHGKSLEIPKGRGSYKSKF